MEGIFFYKADGILKLPANLGHISKWLESVAKDYGFSIKQLNYIFTTDPALREMNKSFLNHEYETDVLTFDLSEQDELKGIEGEIYISLDRIRVQAKEYNTGFKNELMRVMVHGLLHLIGFDDIEETDKAKMRIAEDKALQVF
jgi:probable rRNA maturation factor